MKGLRVAGIFLAALERPVTYFEYRQFKHVPSFPDLSALFVTALFVTKSGNDGQNVCGHLEGYDDLPISPSVIRSSEFGNLH